MAETFVTWKGNKEMLVEVSKRDSANFYAGARNVFPEHKTLWP